MADDASDASFGEPPPLSQPVSDIGIYTCPDCQETVAVDPVERGPFIICPYCGGEFAIAKAADDQDAGAEQQAEADRLSRESELNGMRIKQLSTARRAEIRAQTYMFVGFTGSICGILWLGFEGYNRFRWLHRVDLRLCALVVTALAMVIPLLFFRRKWVEIGRQLKVSALEDPETPPDFSELGDGSEQWKKLEELE